jgi:hypothetical protein
MTLTLGHPSRLIDLVFDLALSRGSARKISAGRKLLLKLINFPDGWKGRGATKDPSYSDF